MSDRGTIICMECGTRAPRTGNVQKYCETCSAAKDLARKAAWKSRNAKPSAPGAHKGANAARRALMAVTADRLAREERVSIVDGPVTPDLSWVVRVAVPFSYVASKNGIYSSGRGGHVFIRREVAQWRDGVIASIQAAMKGQIVRQNKVWVDIFVQKSNHKGDAVNVVDLVCDAVKVAIDLDDRWFSLRSVDWQITRNQPMIYIGVGQEEVEDVQACSCCGRLLSFDKFTKHASKPNGIGRECLECRRGLHQIKRDARTSSRAAARTGCAGKGGGAAASSPALT